MNEENYDREEYKVIMQTAPKQNYGREEYLALEQLTDVKHEFFHGAIFAMAGGTFNHAKITINIAIELGNKLRGKNCTLLGSDMRVHTPSGLDTYPDISVFCGKPELQDNQRTLLNPSIVIEVLSPSTRNYDRGTKFVLYRAIPCLQDYLLVDSEDISVEHYRRLNSYEWILHDYQDITDQIPLTTLEELLSLRVIYEQIEFARE
jgi:Uma2 family endonuclease